MTARLSIVFGGLEDLQNSAKLCREGMPVKIEQLHPGSKWKCNTLSKVGSVRSF